MHEELKGILYHIFLFSPDRLCLAVAISYLLPFSRRLSSHSYHFLFFFIQGLPMPFYYTKHYMYKPNEGCSSIVHFSFLLFCFFWHLDKYVVVLYIPCQLSRLDILNHEPCLCNGFYIQ